MEETITLGGGCFWCMEAVFQNLKGVAKVESGYAGGKTANPTYEQVCSGETGHAEVVQITFDNQKIHLKEILEVFFALHDPTTMNRQGADTGTQYRSIILYQTKEQEKTAQEAIKKVDTEKIWDKPAITAVAPLSVFYKAEPNHQNYFAQHANQPYCRLVIAPKIQKLMRKFSVNLK